MKYTLALAMIPMVLAWAAHKPAPVIFSAPEIAVKNITPENITARRADVESSFKLRWANVADMPPTIEVRHRELASNAGVAAEPPLPPPRQTVQTVQTVRRVALRSDICTRHGMRKVNYGKRWRCRR